MQLTRSARLLPLHLVSMGLLAGAAAAQGDIADVDVHRTSGLRVFAAEKGVYFDTGAGFLQPSAWAAGSAGETPLVVAVDPQQPSNWIAAGRGTGGALRIGRLIANGQDVAFSEIPNSGPPADLDYAPDLAGWVLMPRRAEGAAAAWTVYSSNGGATWSTTIGNDFGDPITQVAFDEVTTTRVVAFTESGAVKLSFNRGANWSNSVANLDGEVVSAVGSPHADGLFFAVTTQGTLWRSTDGGFSWFTFGGEASGVAVSATVPDLLWITDRKGRAQMSANLGLDWSSTLDLQGFDPGNAPLDLQFDAAVEELVVVGAKDAIASLPSAVAAIGQGTEGSGGVRPRHLLTGVLTPGNDEFGLRGDRCANGATVVLLGGNKLEAVPLFGGVVHVGGTLVLNTVAVTGGQQADGEFFVKAPLPANPALIGAEFVTQFAVVDAGASDPSGVVLSPALKLVGLP